MFNLCFEVLCDEHVVLVGQVLCHQNLHIGADELHLVHVAEHWGRRAVDILDDAPLIDNDHRHRREALNDIGNTLCVRDLHIEGQVSNIAQKG